MFDLGTAFLDSNLLILLWLRMGMDIDDSKNLLLLGLLIVFGHTIWTHDSWWTHT